MNQEAENCDIQRRPCKKMYIVGNNIREHTNMKCQMKELQVRSFIQLLDKDFTFHNNLEYQELPYKTDLGLCYCLGREKKTFCSWNNQDSFTVWDTFGGIMLAVTEQIRQMIKQAF